MMGPVGRSGDEIRTSESETAGQLREFEVVANGQSDPAVPSIDYRRRPFARAEPAALTMPEVELAVDGPDLGGLDQGDAVEDIAIGSQLAEAAHDDLLAACARADQVHQRLCRHGAGPRLLGGLEGVPSRGELREQDDLRTASAGHRDRVLYRGEGTRGIRDIRRDLAAATRTRI